MLILSLFMAACFLPFLIPDGVQDGDREDIDAADDEDFEETTGDDLSSLSELLLEDDDLDDLDGPRTVEPPIQGSLEIPTEGTCNQGGSNEGGGFDPCDPSYSEWDPTTEVGHLEHINGTEKNDVLFEPRSSISNGSSGVAIHGMEGNDRIYGEGDVTIDGGEGDDTLILREMSKLGVTVAIGGNGSDSFIVEMAGNDLSGTTTDVIKDFDPEIDRLVIELSSSIQFDPIEDVTYSTSMEPISIDKVVSSTGTTLSIFAMESIQITGPEGDEFLDEVIQREIFLEGIFEMDINDVGFVKVSY
jgi:hypothetical protein